MSYLVKMEACYDVNALKTTLREVYMRRGAEYNAATIWNTDKGEYLIEVQTMSDIDRVIGYYAEVDRLGNGDLVAEAQITLWNGEEKSYPLTIDTEADLESAKKRYNAALSTLVEGMVKIEP